MGCPVTPSIGPIDPEEVKLLEFDFSSELASDETIVGTPEILITYSSGTIDPSPMDIKDGAPVVDGQKVLQKVRNCVEGTTYHIRAKAGSTGAKVSVLAVDLACRRF